MTAVSLVVPSRGGRETLPELLDSLDEQTCTDFEVIVVVDGDIDDTAGYLATQQRRYPLRSVVFDTNQGRPTALNTGFEEAKGDILVRCDDDFRASAGLVEAMLAASITRAIIGVTRDTFPLGNRYGTVYGYPADASRRASIRTMPPELRWRAWAGLVGTTREVYHRVGRYDTCYQGYGWEDIDWGYRAAQAGIKLVLSETDLATHLKPALSLRQRAEKARAAAAAKRLFCSRHGIELPTATAWSSPWNLAVAGLSRILGPTTIGPVTELFDRLIEVLPASVSRRLSALAVEAAGR